MEDTRAESLPIGAAEAAAALQTLQRYKAGKAALDKRLIDNELWFRMGHWKNYRDPLMPGKADQCHVANESMSLEDLFFNAKVIADAIEVLALEQG